MPPQADQQLEGRILKAAQRLWRTRGEHGLTIRTVARDAGTTTPTVYKRFRNREAILVALAERLRNQLDEVLFGAKSIEEVFRRYLAWAEQHPHEYLLLFRFWYGVMHPELPRPGRAWFMTQLANRFGGQPEDYAQAFHAFLLLAHGAASMIIVSSDEVARDEVRRNFLASADALLENIHIVRN